MSMIASTTRETAGGQPPRCPLNYGVADTRDKVMEAWALVYNAYRRLGIVNPNPWGIHATTHAFTNDTAVIRGCLDDGRCVATVTTYLDHPEHGLPLDSVYGDELNRLRDRGGKIMELGLLADRRAEIGRTRHALFELMRWGSYFGITHGYRQAVVGIHPHHAKFYDKCFGFKIIGSEHKYDIVNGAPVVPLFVDYDKALMSHRVSRGIRYLCDNEIRASKYSSRQRWSAQTKRLNSVPEMLLAETCRDDAAAA